MLRFQCRLRKLKVDEGTVDIGICQLLFVRCQLFLGKILIFQNKLNSTPGIHGGS